MNNIFQDESHFKAGSSTTLFSIALLLLVNNFSLIRIGIPPNIVLGKAGAFLLVLIIIFNLKNIKLSKTSLFFIIGFCVFFSLYLVSTMFEYNSGAIDLFMRYLETLILLISSAFILNENFNVTKFIKIMALGSFVVNLFILFDVIINIGFAGMSNPDIFRTYLIFDFKYRALNALMNGMLFMAFFSFAIVLKKGFWNKWIYNLSVINLILFIFIATLSGSRQTLVGTFIFFMFYALLNISLTRFDFKSIIKKIFLLGVGIFALNIIFIFLKVDFFEIIADRFGFGKRDINSIEDVDSRVGIVEEGLNVFFHSDKFLFGYGMDGFYSVFKLNAHNGFAKIIFETGLIGFSFLLFYIIYYILKSFKGIITLKNHGSIFFKYVLLSILLTFTFIMNIFNEIFEYHYYWIFFLIVLKFSKNEFSNTLKREDNQ